MDYEEDKKDTHVNPQSNSNNTSKRKRMSIKKVKNPNEENQDKMVDEIEELEFHRHNNLKRKMLGDLSLHQIKNMSNE